MILSKTFPIPTKLSIYEIYRDIRGNASTIDPIPYSGQIHRNGKKAKKNNINI